MTRKQGEVGHSIATQLFRVLFGLYLIVAVIVTAIQLSLEYSRAKDMVTKEIQRVPVTFGPGISTSLWTFNDNLLQSILIGMQENPVVVGAIIKDREGKFVRAIGHIVDAEGNAAVFNENSDQLTVDEENNMFSSSLGHEFSITYIDDEGKAQEIGKGVVYSNTSVILERVKDCFIDILINSVIKILVLGAIFLFVIRKILGRPLGRLTDAVEKLSFDNLGHQKMDIQVSKRNELKVLEESFNAMTDKLKRDVTKREQAEEARRLTQFAVDSASVSVFRVTPEGKFTYVNDAACKSLGYSREEMLEMSVADIDPDYPQEGRSSFWEELEQQQSLVFESRHLAKDSRIFPVEVTCRSLELYGQKYEFAFAQDITERKEAEKTLRESERRLTATQALGLMGDWEYDVNTQHISWSDEVFNLYERDPSSGPLTVEEEATYYSPEDIKRLREYGRRAIEEGESFNYDIRVNLPGGKSAYMMDSMRPISDESGIVVKLSGIIQDITGRKKSEQKLLDYQRQLRHFAAELSRVEENDRREIATELHDRIGQTLAMSKIKVLELEKSLSSSDFGQSIKTVCELLDQTIQDTRNLTFEISPTILYELGFEEAADWLVEQMQKQYEMQIKFTSSRHPKPMDDDIRFVLY